MSVEVVPGLMKSPAFEPGPPTHARNGAGLPMLAPEPVAEPTPLTVYEAAAWFGAVFQKDHVIAPGEYDTARQAAALLGPAVRMLKLAVDGWNVGADNLMVVDEGSPVVTGIRAVCLCGMPDGAHANDCKMAPKAAA